MGKEMTVAKSPLLETLETTYSMSIGDGFSYLWKQLMSIPMSSLVYFVCLLVGLNPIFSPQVFWGDEKG